MEETNGPLIQFQQELIKLCEKYFTKEEPKKEFEDGDWIHRKEKNGEFCHIFKYKNIGLSHVGVYISLSVKSKSISEDYSFTYDTFKNGYENRHATKKEIEETLLEIARQKGYVPGVVIKSEWGASNAPRTGTKTAIISDVMTPALFIYLNTSGGNDILIFDSKTDSNLWVYRDKLNKWADIVKTYEIIPGYPVIWVDKDSCIINKTLFMKSYIRTLIQTLESININHNPAPIQSINVGCTGQYQLTISDLKKLLDNWQA